MSTKLKRPGSRFPRCNALSGDTITKRVTQYLLQCSNEGRISDIDRLALPARNNLPHGLSAVLICPFSMTTMTIVT